MNEYKDDVQNNEYVKLLKFMQEQKEGDQRELNKEEVFKTLEDLAKE